MTGIVELDDAVLATQTNPHFMQSDAWATFKNGSDWELGSVDSAPQSIVARTYSRDVEGFGRLLHLPRVSGLSVDNVGPFTEAVRAATHNFLAAKLEIFQAKDEALRDALVSAGWTGARSTQYRFGVTALCDPDAEVAFSHLKKRARTEVRQADTRGITVRRAEPNREIEDVMLAMMDVMQERSGAFVRPEEYLRNSWQSFVQRDQGSFYAAEVEGKIVATAFVIEFGTNAFYKDGGSVRVDSRLPVGRALQWHIIKDLGERGFTRYDLGNVPNPAEESETMSGLLTFKSGFAADVIEYMPALELPLGSRAEEWRAVEPELIAAYKQSHGDSFY